MIITFCGHSTYIPQLNDEMKLINLFHKISNGKKIDFYLGGYGNFDNFAKQCAKKYKETHLESKLIFVTPYLGKWLNDRKSYLEAEYDEIIYPELEHIPLKFAINKRNAWMINQADFVFAYVELDFGGAYNALTYAKKQNKPYLNLYER